MILKQLSESHIRIFLDKINVNVRIGLFPHEQEGGRSQRVIVSIELFAPVGDYLSGATHKTIIDYDHIYGAVQSWAERPHTLLIETYLEELVAICFQDKRIAACRVSVSKPDVFQDVENAGVEVFMTRDSFQKS
ncbi:MAG: dihydroneopterin aldolase [Alphaproteobacteria bacterium]